MRTYSGYYSSYHFASLSLLSLLRSVIAIPIIITSLSYRYSYYYHFARLSSLLLFRSVIVIIIISNNFLILFAI